MHALFEGEIFYANFAGDLRNIKNGVVQVAQFDLCLWGHGVCAVEGLKIVGTALAMPTCVC